MLPRTGGIYEYLRRAWGPLPAFLFGWAKLVLLIPSAVGSFAKLGAWALVSLLGLPPSPARDAAVAVGMIAACTLVNVAGVRRSATGQALVTAVKYAAVALVAALGLFWPFYPLPPTPGVKLEPFHAVPSLVGCFGALVSVMWAYDGWADLSELSGEVRRPERTLPRALIAGTVAIVVVYLAANFGYARTLGLDGLRRATSGADMAGAHVAVATLGDRGRVLFAALLLVSCVGGCMSSLLTGSRVFVPLATDGLFVRWLGVVSGRGVPARAVLVSAALGACYVCFRSYEQLTDGFVVGYFPFYMLGVAAVWVLRRREPELARPFLVPGYPWVPIVFLVGAAALLVGAVADADRTAPLAFAILLLGLPVRWLWRRWGGARAT
jgi:APA family basic amino acid/polyamine antiporter